MARLPRLSVAGVALHVIQRGNNREACFFSDQDYTVYLDNLKEYSKRYYVSVHAFVLMTNHVHLLVTPQTATGASQMMQALGRYYVRYINNTYQRTGTLWEGRFKSTLVDNDRYFLTVSRYIELNPVRAGMVEHAAEYPWSSYQANALGKPIDLITPHSLYKKLGRGNRARQQSYAALFDGQMTKKTIDEITQSTLKGWVLGSEQFKQKIEDQVQRRVKPQGRGGDRKSKAYQEKVKNQLL